jgi:hypothetical protein
LCGSYLMLSKSEIPMIGGMHNRANIGDYRRWKSQRRCSTLRTADITFAFQRVAAIAPPSVATSCTAPKGMLKRIVVKESKPKLLTINGPKVLMPVGNG